MYVVVFMFSEAHNIEPCKLQLTPSSSWKGKQTAQNHLIPGNALFPYSGTSFRSMKLAN